MNLRISIITMTGVFLFVAVAYIGLGSFSQWVYTVMALTWAGLPALLFLVLRAFMTMRDKGMASFTPLLIAVGLGMSALLNCKAGEAICDWEVKRAKLASPQVVKHVEDVRKATGAYPAALVGVSAPRLLEYKGSGSAFVLFLNDPRFLLGGWVYDQGSQQWKFED